MAFDPELQRRISEAQNDPELRRLVSQWSANSGARGNQALGQSLYQQMHERLRTLIGVSAEDYRRMNLNVEQAQNGGLTIEPNATWGDFWKQSWPLLIPGVVGATPDGWGGVFSGGGAVSGSAGAGTGSAAGASGATAGASTAGAGTGGTVAGLSTRDWINIGSRGVDVASEWYRQRQADRAAGREIDMSKEALALEKEMFEKEQAYQREQDAENRRRYDQEYARDDSRYQQGREDFAPYRSIGLGALDRLAFGVGIPGKPSEAGRPAPRDPNVAPAPTPIQPWDPSTMGPIPSLSGGTLATLGSPQAANVSGGGMTTMRTPTGQTVLVPAAKVQEAIANGGTVLQQGAA